MKYKVGDRVKIKSLDWYNKNKDELGKVGYFTFEMRKFCGQILIISEKLSNFYCMENIDSYIWTDEMIEGLVEDETPKFKVNDIVFVKNLGWVRITNSYWDSLANEYIYEAIGNNGKDEYDSINQSNIDCQMQPESENPHTCGNKITLEEYKNNDKEWLFNKLAMLDNITALESIQDIFNHLQRYKYPKTYEECSLINGAEDRISLKIIGTFTKLINARNAYWKIAGEEMGLGKPWEPQGTNTFSIFYDRLTGEIEKQDGYCGANSTLEFPTPEMRDAFYENFKEEIEECKELL